MGSGDVPGTGSGLCKGTEADRCSVFMHQKQNQGAGVCREKGSTGGEGWETRGGLRCRVMVRRRLLMQGWREPSRRGSGAFSEAPPGSESGRGQRWLTGGAVARAEEVGQTAHRTGCGLGRRWWGNKGLQGPCPRLWPEPRGRCWWDFLRWGPRGRPGFGDKPSGV